MEPMYYIGLDVHKLKISYCLKDSGGKLCAEGWIPATRRDLDCWMKNLPRPWSAAMEATMFTGWSYDHLKPHAAMLLSRLACFLGRPLLISYRCYFAPVPLCAFGLFRRHESSSRTPAALAQTMFLT